MKQSRKEFFLGILLTFLLWLFGPEIIPEKITPYIKPVIVAIIILAGVWIFIGEKIINWYSNTSNERKQKKIKSLQSEFIDIQAAYLHIQSNPDFLLKSASVDIFGVLFDLCLGFLIVNVTSLFDFFSPIPIGIIAIPSFWNAFNSTRNNLKFYKRILFFKDYQAETDANIRKLSSTNKQSNLIIKRAIYRVKNIELKLNVTKLLINKLIDNKIDFIVGDDILLFDPAPGLQKELTLKYSINRQEKEITVAAGERLILP